MAKRYTVYLWPPQGGGVQAVVSTGRTGEQVMVPIPFCKYERLRSMPEILDVKGMTEIRFVNQSGHEVRSNLPYTIVCEDEAEGNA